MKNLLFGSLIFNGYALFQGLGFIAKAYPPARVGVALIVLLSLAILGIFGLNNLCGVFYRNDGYVDRTQTIISFAPFFALGTIAIVAVVCGLYVAG